jgi:tagatose 1,6-diphosphate aldolase
MLQESLPVGKYRALQRCSTSGGVFAILAIDHQDALKRALQPGNPTSVTAEVVTQFKMNVVDALSSETSGVLLDPVYGAPQAVAGGILRHAGLLVELERADYQMQPMPLDVEIDPAWNVAKIKHMGADGVKLFFYYNPTDRAHTARQDAVVRDVIADCGRFDIPLYAEPIVYQSDEGASKRQLVIESARRIAQLGADVLKLEFPCDVQQTPDASEWFSACAELTATAGAPWVLLSAGVSFDLFARQLEIACKAGASGFIVGRALWGEATQIQDAAERALWLKTVGRQRIQMLNGIADRHACSWMDWYAAPTVSTAWFKQYKGDGDDE